METKDVVLSQSASTGNDYLDAVIFAFKEFLLEEAGGNMFAEYRLMDKIQKAKTNHSASRDELDKIITPVWEYTNVLCRYSKSFKPHRK